MKKGITLISLVVTIIILLILAGVTLNIVLGDNGIITMAKKSKEKTEEASDEEIISMQMMLMQMNEEEANIGTTLYDKNFENSDKWHLIIENENRYGTGYTYFKKGTNIGGSILSSSYIKNNETGEMKKLEEGKYVELSVNDSLGTKEGLIFNLDPSVIEESKGKTISEIGEELGTGVKLHGFDETSSDTSGVTSTSFNFDGKDDWIEVQYDDNEKKDEMIENGFTFEFYGDALIGRLVLNDVGEATLDGGGFGWGNETRARLKFQIWRKETQLQLLWAPVILDRSRDIIPKEASDGGCWHVGPEINELTGYDWGPGKGWSSYAEYDLGGEGDFYISITFNPKKTKEINGHTVCEEILYVNGKYVSNGWYYLDFWNALKDEKDNLKHFCVGRTSQNTDNAWFYGKIKCYNMRLYSRPLTSTEVGDNYLKTIAYHSMLGE